VFRRLRFPYTIGLVIVGMLLAIAQDHLGVMEPIRLIRLTPEVVLYLFLPTLIFPAAVQMDLRLLRQNAGPILLLALPGLIVSTVIVGSIVAALTPLSWSRALLFGALISATDPVAVVALFNELKVPHRLAILVEGESLFNDATSLVLFTVILATIGSDAVGTTVVAQGAARFIWVSLGGLGVGASIAVLYAVLVRLVADDPLVEIALSTVLAYMAFIVADHYMHVSGIVAVVAAGLVARRLRLRHFDSAQETRLYLRHYWRYAEFVANSFVFFFLGIGGNTFLNRLHAASLAELGYIGAAILATVVARLVVVVGFITLWNRCTRAEPIAWGYQAVMFWPGGIRGALPLVLVLSLPLAFEQRQLLLGLTAGVVFFTLLVAGTTAGRLIRAVAPQ